MQTSQNNNPNRGDKNLGGRFQNGNQATFGKDPAKLTASLQGSPVTSQNPQQAGKGGTGENQNNLRVRGPIVEGQPKL